jgi:hypothetical protein
MRSRFKWLISFSHAFILLAFSAYWMNTSFTYGDEQLLIKWSSIFKRLVLNIDKDPPKKDFIFINVAFDKALIPLQDGLGNEVITDRGKLVQIFQVIKKHQQDIKFTVCDVFLQGKSDQDSLLQSAVTGIKNVVFPTHIDKSGNIEKLAIKVSKAIADYRTTNSGFMKFKLFQSDSLPTIPVLLYEKINHSKFKFANGIHWDNDKASHNSIIIDYQIRAHEVFDEKEYPIVTLSELLLLPDAVIFNEFLKDRIVIIGDFNADVHETIFGATPGTLILLNIYLTLKDGQHLVSIWWLIFIFIGFTVFSRLMLFPAPDEDENNPSWFGPLLASATYLTLFSIISYLLFNQHLQVLIITLYINLLRFSIQMRQVEWNKTQFKKWLFALKETYFNFK